MFARKTKFISPVEFERKWNESLKLSESRDVMTRSVSRRVSLSGSGCCALPELNLGRLAEWSGIDTGGYFVISSPLVRVVPRSPSGLDENHEARGFRREEQGEAGIVPTINERLARVHEAHKSSRLCVSLARHLEN